jgi:LAO/AO transport system kinase
MRINTEDIIRKLEQGDRRVLAKAITIVENELPGYIELLLGLQVKKPVPIIGITGPPGSGKSTLVNCLIEELLKNAGTRVGVISVDPSSPIHQGAILGDRLRMAQHFSNNQVFIRSLASRGALGGLSAKAIEVTELMRSSGFDYVLVETVGIGQSEVEIAGLADVTILVLTPEGGDEIQAMKSGVMEVADIFVVNKSDREGAEEFSKNLYQTMPLKGGDKKQTDVVQTIAIRNSGIDKLKGVVEEHLQHKSEVREINLIAEKVHRLVMQQRMKGINKENIKREIAQEISAGRAINIYQFATKIATSL